MRILWVKVGGLWPVNTGGRLRTFNIISELSRRNQVTVIGTHHPDEDGDALRQNLPHCTKVTSLPFAAPKRGSLAFVGALAASWFSALPVDLSRFRIDAVRDEVGRALQSGNFDLCIADFLVAVPNVPDNVKVPVIHFSHNVEHMIWKRLCANEGNLLKRLVLEMEWRKMKRFEAAACRRCDLTIAVSEEDRTQLQALAPGALIRSVPTGVDINFFQPGELAKQEPLELVFSGSMDWQPNEDAILFFIDAILPLVRSRVPQVSLTVVGRNPGTALRAAAERSQVQVTGTVDDIRPYVERAAVYIVPLRIGGGTRLKIFEALAMGKAIVSTTIGAEGLPLDEGVHVLRADDPASFANKVVDLLEDRQQRERLGTAGRALVEEHFSWPRVAEQFEACCRSVLPGKAEPVKAVQNYSAIT